MAGKPAPGPAGKRAVVVGGGLVGGVAALSLQQRGYRVTLLERRERVVGESEMDSGRPEDKSVSRRSINLALSARGQAALQSVGLLETVMGAAVPMRCRAIHTGGGGVSFQPYDEVDARNYINSISRELLQDLLMQRCERSGVEVLYGQALTHIDRSGTLHLEPAATLRQGASFDDCHAGSRQIAGADLVVGCDGAYSVVREAMSRLQSTDFSRKYINHSYKELEIKPHPVTGDWQLQPVEALHIWPRGDFMMIALPNPDKSFTCTLFAPNAELQRVKSREDVTAYFTRHFPDAVQYMPDFCEQFQKNPACRLVMLEVSPWHVALKAGPGAGSKTHVVLLGDAAHAMVPFFGQGMNAGMEDALELAETLDKHDSLDAALPAFVATREPRGRAIVQLSLDNYKEMRSHTASRLFLLRKKLEGWLNWAAPNTWIPLYKMVAFTRIPYDEAMRREAFQDKVVHAIGYAALGGLAALALLAAPRLVAAAESLRR
jgi:kynurenine 3-monooxygenase